MSRDWSHRYSAFGPRTSGPDARPFGDAQKIIAGVVWRARLGVIEDDL